MYKCFIVSCLLLGLYAFRADGQSNNGVTNYYGILTTCIKFNNLNYTLSWSTHPLLS